MTPVISVSCPSPPDQKEDELHVGTPIGCGKEACKTCLCGFNNYWKMLIGFTVVFVYLLLGGLFFNLLERPNEILTIQTAQEEREAAADLFREQADNFTAMIVSMTNLTEEQARSLTDSLVQGAINVANTSQMLPAETDPIWDYASAVFFASTVITTIGEWVCFSTRWL